MRKVLVLFVFVLIFDIFFSLTCNSQNEILVGEMIVKSGAESASFSSTLFKQYLININLDGNVESIFDINSNISTVGYSHSGTVVDSKGYIYSTGTYGLISKKKQIYLSKVDSNGNIIWENTINKPNNSFGISVELDSQGSVYVSGYEYEGNYNRNAILAKYSNDGNKLWEKVIDNSYSNTFLGLEVDSNDNILVTGYKGGPPPGRFAGYLIKYSPEGKKLWEKSQGNYSSNVAQLFDSVVSDEFDNYYVVGSGTVLSGDPGFIIFNKYSKSGDLIFEKIIGGPKDDRAKNIWINDNSLYLIGWSNSFPGADFGDGGNKDIYLLKYDLDGNLEWYIEWGGTGDEYANDIMIFKEDIYVVGRSNSFSGADYGDGGGYDTVIIKFNSHGQLIWDKEYGSSKLDLGIDIYVDNWCECASNYIRDINSNLCILINQETEICNGIDDDRDGFVDEGGVCFENKNSILSLNSNNDSNLDFSINCSKSIKSTISLIDSKNNKIMLSNNLFDCNTSKNTYNLINDLNKGTYSLNAEINQPCEICKKTVIVNILKEEQEVRIYDNSLVLIILLLGLVVFFIKRERI